MERRAKIVATLGPASSSPRLLGRLLRAGVDVVRLNLSHGSHEEHRARIALVRELAEAQRKHVGVLLDLMGPRFRLGVIAGGPRLLRKGERVALDEPGPRGEGPDLPVDDPEFLGHLEPGERVLIDNGRVELRVVAKRRGRVEARVMHGGFVDTRKGINIPDTDLPFTISRKDRADIAFAVAEGADYLAASYIGRGEELARLRAVARRAGRELPVVAKLERARAIEHLDEVVAAADAVMVARGDLGVEMPLAPGAGAAEADRRGGTPPGEAGHRRHPDARVDDRPAAADARRGLGRRQRGVRRRRRPDALRRDRRRPPSGRGGAHHGPHHPRGRGLPLGAGAARRLGRRPPSGRWCRARPRS